MSFMTTPNKQVDCGADLGPAVNTSGWAEASLAVVVIVVRFVSQNYIAKGPLWDDWCMLLALLLGLSNTALISASVCHGLGQHWDCLSRQQQIFAMKYEFIAQPAGIMCPTIARISFCIYLLRFTGTDKRKRTVFWGIIITQLLVNLMTMIEVLVSCEHFASLWDPNVKGRCWSPEVQAYMGFVQGGWNSLTDLALTFLPFLILKNLNMKFSTKAALSVIMGMSIFAMVACIVKTVELKYIGERMDFTYDTSKSVIWFTLEQYVVVIAASIPTIRPLMLSLIRKYSDRRDKKGPASFAQRLAKPFTSSQESPRPWRPNAIRLNSVTEGDKLELEPPYIHPEPKSLPQAGTIRKTISIYITSERRSGYELSQGNGDVAADVSAESNKSTTDENDCKKTQKISRSAGDPV